MGPSPRLAALLYLCLAVLWTAPASLSPADTLPDLGDPVHLSYVMAWDAHQIVRRPWALFDSNSFYPYERSLTFGDHLLPEALLGAPVFWATGNAVLSSNFVLVTALTLSAFTMFLLLRRVTGSSLAAFLAGLAYAFNSWSRNEILRVHVLNIQWWPLALLFLDRFVHAGARRRDALLFAACLVLQGLSGTYYLAYTAMIAPLWLVASYALAKRRPAWAELRTLTAALAVAALPALVILTPYAIQMRTMGFEKELADGLDLLSYFDPARGNALWGWIDLKMRFDETEHFVGFATGALALAGLGVVVRRRATAATGVLALLTLAFGLALSLGPRIAVAGTPLFPGPYKLLYEWVPPARGMAGPERISVLVVLATAILLGLGASALLERVRVETRVAASGLLAALLLAEHWSPSHPAAAIPTGADVPAVYAWLAADGAAPMVELPLYPDLARRFWALYLNLSTHHWRPIPFGRTSFYPPEHDLLAWYLREFPGGSSLDLLEHLGIRTVVVHPLAWEDEGERGARITALKREPRLTLVQRFEDEPSARYEELELGRERVYRIVGESAARATPCAPQDELPRAGWTLGGRGATSPEAVRDGDRRTAWFTARPQRPGESLDVTLPAADTVAAVALELFYPYDEFPRGLKLLSWEQDAWQRVEYLDGPAERWATIQELLSRPKQARMVLRFAPRTVTRLRLALGGKHADPAWPRWSVPELRLYRDCR